MNAPASSDDLGRFLERAVAPSGWRIVYEPVVGSTMDLGREAARRGWPERSVFVCDFQSAGKGRRERRWEAATGHGLLFTLLLRSVPPVLATMLCSVALCEAVERLLKLEPSIKWPNDLMIRESKLAGVLAEGFSAPRESYTLVGCGVNANQRREDLASLGRAATSLRIEAGRTVHRGELLILCLEQVDGWLGVPAEQRATRLRAAWEERLWGLGERRLIREEGEELSAVIAGVDVDGALLVKPEGGPVRRLLSAEIVLDS